MRRVLGAVAACLAVLAPTLGLSRGAAAADELSAGDELIRCLADRGRPLGVLFVVDTSQSLGKTDPGAEPARVKGLASAVEALGQVAEERPVIVDTIQFGTGWEPSFTPDEWPQWGALDLNAPRLATLMRKFAERNRSEDTDYGSALLGARSALASTALPGNACRLVVWFTDGKFDLDYQGRKKTVEWMNPPLTITRESDEDAANAKAQEQICSPDGIADAFRGGQQSVEEGAPYVVGVALGSETSDFNLFDRIVSNASGNCGSSPAFGSVLNAANLDELIESLIQAADPSIGRGLISSFTVSEALSSLRLRVDWEADEVAPTVVDPTGQSIGIGSTGEVVLESGAKVTVDLEAPTQATIAVDLPADVRGWAGDWSFRSGRSSPPRGDLYLQGVQGELRAVLEGDTVVRRGRPSPLVIAIVGPNGELRSGAAWHPQSSLQLASRPGVAVLNAPVAPGDDGKVRLSLDLDQSFGDSTIELTGSIAPVVEVLPGVITDLTQWTGQMIGSIAVKDLPKSPIVDPPLPFERPFDQDHLSLETTLPVEAVGAESGGCVTVEGVSLEASDTPVGQARLFDGDREIAVGEPCALELAAGEKRLLTLRIDLSLEESRQAGLLEGVVNFVASSSQDSSEQERYAHSFKVRVVPQTIETPPGPIEVLPWLLLAVAGPIILLYLYNFFVGTRLALGPRATAVLDVQLVGEQLQLRSGGGGAPSSIVYDAGLLQFDFRGDEPQRSLQFHDAEFRARVSRLPWGEPYGVVEVSGASLVVAQSGSDRQQQRGLTPLQVSPGWAFWANPSGEAVSGGSAGDLVGTLLLVVPWGIGDIYGAQSVFDDLVRDAGLTVATEYETWLSRRPVKEKVDPPIGPVSPTEFNPLPDDGFGDTDTKPTPRPTDF